MVLENATVCRGRVFTKVIKLKGGRWGRSWFNITAVFVRRDDWDTDTHRGKIMGRHGEECHVQAIERGTLTNQTCQQLKLLSSKIVKKKKTFLLL